MKVGAVITAAGCSRRMKKFKLTMEIGGRTVIEHTLSGVYNLASEIVVVGGCMMDELNRVLEPYAKVRLIKNDKYELGMFTSVKRGLLETDADYIFITPGDCLLIKERVYSLLLKNKDGIVIPSYKGRAGHPVLISSHKKELILSEPDTSNLKAFIKKHEVRYVEVDTDEILMDLDVPEDFEKIKERIRNG